MTSRRRNIHPFPARMAPAIALEKIEELTQEKDTVLDPMCGSGTVPSVAASSGRQAIASDVDPLAVLMTRTSCRPQLSRGLSERARVLVNSASSLDASLPAWINADKETAEFCDFWFAESQIHDLSRLSRVLATRGKQDDPLRIALSRMIVTKTGGASLARDTSHSRPHKVADTNAFDTFNEFIRAAQWIEECLVDRGSRGRARIRTADARALGFISRGSVDLVLTSPPYLNAIDYLRGHRMALIWLGKTIGELRTIRGESIGSERMLLAPRLIDVVEGAVPEFHRLGRRQQGMVVRFASDMDRLCRSMSRVVREGGRMVLVVADSMLKGIPVSNSQVAIISARRRGFRLDETVRRPLPSQHRYLPPPDSIKGSMASRMREEIVLTFSKGR